MVDKCSVRSCRGVAMLYHRPLQAHLCSDCWGDYCNGKKLEIVAWKKEVKE